jgi:ATP-binding cassette subfamily B protein
VLDHGRLAESGTHHALLAKGGLYAEMWSRQAAERRGEAALIGEAAE